MGFSLSHPPHPHLRNARGACATTSIFQYFAAKNRGPGLSLVHAFTSVPCSSSMRTSSTLPLLAALCNGGSPFIILHIHICPMLDQHLYNLGASIFRRHEHQGRVIFDPCPEPLLGRAPSAPGVSTCFPFVPFTVPVSAVAHGRRRFTMRPLKYGYGMSLPGKGGDWSLWRYKCVMRR